MTTAGASLSHLDLALSLIKDVNNNGVIDSGDTLATSQNLNSPGESMTRVYWSLGQLLVGVAVVVGAHVWALTQVSSAEVRARGQGSWSLMGLWRTAAAGCDKPWSMSREFSWLEELKAPSPWSVHRA